MKLFELNFKFNFWLWLLRYAYRQIKTSQPKLPVGIPGNRDPEATCTGYAPRKRLPGDAIADCQTDGHYLCKECIFKEITNPE